MTFFLTHSSRREWKYLYLDSCYIQDHGLDILRQELTSCDVTISALDLDYNGLTKHSSSAIIDITIVCKIKCLRISGNKFIGENETLYSIISDPSSTLEILNICNTKLSSSGAIKLFTVLSENKKMRRLNICYNDICDQACDAIIMTIKRNTSLTVMIMASNPISGECVYLIIQALQENSNLQLLSLPYGYSKGIKKKIRLSADEITRKEEITEYTNFPVHHDIIEEYIDISLRGQST